ncbi:MAG: signal peptidase I [Minisyncoccia bacterium]
MGKNFLNNLWETIKILILALVIVLPIRYFIFQPFLVKGISMEPSFYNGDYLIVDEISYYFRDPERGEVIVFHYPKDESQRFIKRVIGLPKEKVYISNNKIYIITNDERVLEFSSFDSSFFSQIDKNAFYKNFKNDIKVINLGENEYFVMGDNRTKSFDSRNWGAVFRKEIIGRVILRLWPINNITYFGK